MEIFRKSWQPCHNTTVTKLVQQSILISKTCIHSKFQYDWSKNCAKNRKKSFFSLSEQGCQLYILKTPFSIFHVNYIHSVWLRARKFSRIGGRIWKKLKFWKKLWKKLATLSWYIKPTGTNLAKKLVFTAKACLNSKFHMFRSENVPKEAKKSFSSVYKAGMPTIYSYFPFFSIFQVDHMLSVWYGARKKL